MRTRYHIGILTAIAGTSPGDTMISDLIAGFIFHGKPLAVMSCFAFANPILGELTPRPRRLFDFSSPFPHTM